MASVSNQVKPFILLPESIQFFYFSIDSRAAVFHLGEKVAHLIFFQFLFELRESYLNLLQYILLSSFACIIWTLLINLIKFQDIIIF